MAREGTRDAAATPPSLCGNPCHRGAVVQRGDITVWFDEEVSFAWNASPSGRPGGQRRYSDLAIVTSLTLRAVFHLPLRQTEGFVASLIGLMGLALQTPDHTTLSRRNRDVEIPRLARGHDGPLHLVIDSTGLKIFGNGEWQAHKHKASNQRRRWRKLHLGIDGDGCIIASALTDSGEDDASVGISMLEQIEGTIAQFTADGAYDTTNRRYKGPFSMDQGLRAPGARTITED